MYKAIVAKIDDIQPIANADNIQLAKVLGYFVIVNKSQQVGDMGILFPDDGKLSAEYLKLNNLYRHEYNNEDQNKKGFFEDSGQIRALKLRGAKSDCYFAAMESLSFFGDIKNLKLGDEVQTFNGKTIAEKYVSKSNQRASGGENNVSVRFASPKLGFLNKLVKRYKHVSAVRNIVAAINYVTETTTKGLFPSFKEHQDSQQFRLAAENIQVGSRILVFPKYHGCVAGDTLVDTLEFGSIKISDIVNNRLKCRIKSMDVETDEIVYKNVNDYYFLKDDGDWYELELEDGTKLQITGNNPVWIPTLGVYRRVWDLEVGDVLTKST